ncbi:MAG: TonB-dependent receptor [Parvibaculaceae bacterium]
MKIDLTNGQLRSTASPWTLIFCTVTFVTALAVVPAASAQEASADSSADLQNSGAPDANAAAEEDGVLIYDRIVVSARKRDESISDIPIAISAFTGESLELAGVNDVRELQLVTPGLVYNQAAYVPQPSIRGIGGRGTGPGSEQAVPIYIDGVYQSFILGGIFELNSIERIEVLKGPQGTLLGRNATGGAINILTKDPVEGFEGNATLGYGSFNEVRAETYLSGGSDTLRANLSIQYLGDDGYVKERTSGEDIAGVDTLGIRGKILFKPTEATTVTLGANWSERDDNSSLALYALDGNSLFARSFGANTGSNGDYEVFLSDVPFLTMTQKGASLTVEHDFGFATLTSITGISDGKVSYDADQDTTDFGPVNVGLSLTQTDNSTTEDIYLASNGDGPFSWVIGGFYLSNESSQDPVIIGPGVSEYAVFATTDAYAFYGEGSYEFDTGTTLTAGGRYSFDEKCASADEFIAGGNGVLDDLPETCADWTSFDPTVTIGQKLGQSANVYFRYAEAYKAGLFNASNFDANPVDPEHVKQFELGLKADVTPWLQIDAAVYQSDYKDIQVTSRNPENLSVLTLNAAEATITGVELNAVARVTEQLNLRAALSQIDHEYDTFENALGNNRRPGGGNATYFFDASGRPLVKVPDTTASLSADYTMPFYNGDLTLAGNLSYQSEYSWDIEGRVNQPATTIVNARLTWLSYGDKFKVQLWGKNLTDENVPLSVTISSLGDAGRDIRPASYGISGTVSF